MDPTKVHRGAYVADEAEAITDCIGRRDAQYGQALRFITSTGARIDEVFHLRGDKVFSDERYAHRQGMVVNFHQNMVSAM